MYYMTKVQVWFSKVLSSKCPRYIRIKMLQCTLVTNDKESYDTSMLGLLDFLPSLKLFPGFLIKSFSQQSEGQRGSQKNYAH